MKDGLLKDIPVVVTAFSVLKLGATYARIFTNYNDKNNSFPEFLEKLDVFKFQDTIVSENQYGIESYVLEHLFQSVAYLTGKLMLEVLEID